MATTFRWYGARVSATLSSTSVTGTNNAAQRLKALSVPRAPLRDGALRASCQVRPAAGNHLTAAVSYNTVYARRQHEELDWHHRHGEAKYLERPLRENSAELQAIIAAAVRAGLA